MNVRIKSNTNKNKKVLFKNLSNSSSSNLKALERRKNRLKQEQSAEEWSDYCLDRLFDPEELHYTPMPELLKRYKKRNLRIGRMFNLAKKYGYVPPIRDRKIQAPQMERAGQRIYGTENFYRPPEKKYFCTMPNTFNTNEHESNESLNTITDDDNDDDDDEQEKEIDSQISYMAKLNERKQLRNGLNQLDLNVNYLERKKSLTEIEKKILHQMKFVDKEMQTDPVKPKAIKNVSVNGKIKSITPPKINYPTPSALIKIEQFLDKNKLRLIDLFKDLDKNKDWKIYKKDFLKKCQTSDLKISNAMVEELVNALGKTSSNKIDYKSLVDGRTSHLSERRSALQKSRESIRSNDYEELSNVKNKSIAPKLTITKEQSRPTSSSLSVDSNNDNNYLKLPEIDKSQCYYPKIVNNNNYYDESSSLIKNDNKLKIKTFTDKSISALSLNHKTKLNDRASRLTMSDYVDLNNNNIILHDKKELKINESSSSSSINEIMKNKKNQLRDLDDKNYIEFLQLQRNEKEKLMIANDNNSHLNISNNADELNDSYALVRSNRVERKLLHGLYAPKDSSMNDIMKQLSKRVEKKKNATINVKAMTKEAKLVKKVDHKKEIDSSSTIYV